MYDLEITWMQDGEQFRTHKDIMGKCDTGIKYELKLKKHKIFEKS
jgi:hypothetical protein